MGGGPAGDTPGGLVGDPGGGPTGTSACDSACGVAGGTLARPTGDRPFSGSDTPSYSGVFCESCLPTSPSSVRGVRLRGDYKHPAHRRARILWGALSRPRSVAASHRVRLRG
nr:hypothetical protein GCM10020092_005960 [Actinoplanes digitatis]